MAETKYNIIRRRVGEKAGRVVNVVRGEKSRDQAIKTGMAREFDPNIEWVWVIAPDDAKAPISKRDWRRY